MTMPERTTKILFVVRSLHVGGMEQMVIELATSLHGRGYDIRFCTIEDPGQLASQLQRPGIEPHALNNPPGLRLDYAYHLRKLIASWRPDIIHTHNETGHFYASLANMGIFSTAKLIHTKHGRGDLEDRKSILRNRISSLLTDVVVAVSDDVGTVCRDIENVSAGKVRTIINGISLEPYLALNRDEPDTDPIVFGHVGRLTSVKNQKLMIDAFHKVHNQLPHSRLVIAGDGPLRPELEAQVLELGIASSVSFLGYQSDIASVVADLDVFLLTSVSEGTPLVVIEAMAAACPVIATDVGGLPEMIEHHQSGLLVPSGDVEALTKNMLLLANNKALRQQIGQRSRSIARSRYGIERMVQDYCDVYGSMVG